MKARQQEVHHQSAAIRAALRLSPTTSTGRGPKYLFSSLLVCGQCGYKFVIVDPKRYGCSGWLYRGLSVCSNTIKVSRKVVESGLLESIQRDLFAEEGFTIFKKEVTKLLAEHHRTQAPDRDRMHAKLEQVEQVIDNIMDAIKRGILTVSTKAELEKAEAERAPLQGMIKARTAKADNMALLLPNLNERFKTLVANLATVTHQHVDKAREVLKSLLGGQIALHPCSDGAERYLIAEVSGNYEGLLRLALSQNKGGGGQAIQPSLAPLLRFEIQGIAIAA